VTNRDPLNYRLVAAAPVEGEAFVEISLADRRFHPKHDIFEWGEIGQEQGEDELWLTIYEPPRGKPWRLPLEDVLVMIRDAESVYRNWPPLE
jgi:hypothetical protein